MTILVSRIFTQIAQETGDKVTEAAMDAAIHEAVKDIPYPTDEEETINISHEFTGTKNEKEEYEYTISNTINLRAQKLLRFNITLTYKVYTSSLGRITFRLKLPSGGKYYIPNYTFYSGGEIIYTITKSKSVVSASAFGDKVTEEYTKDYYITRLS